MRTHLRAFLFTSAMVLMAPLATAALSPACAQPTFSIGFDAFHDQLNGYGDWLYSDRWGEVWRPWQQDQDTNWRPYMVGHWAFTEEYGWTWISDEGPWGDIAYHYGRWVFDPDDGWLWLTGYVWSPAWVVWRSAGPNVGWMPMPPDDAFLGFGGPDISVNISFGSWGDTGGFYGYSRWYGRQFDQARFSGLWTFVPAAHVADPGYRTYVVPRPQVVNIIRNSVNITNYTVVNNVVVNKSVNVTIIQNAGGRPVAPVHAATVLRNTRWVAPVNQGRQVQAQMRQLHPRGNGIANSAPSPTRVQVQGLSSRPIPTHGAGGGPGGTGHLFNKANVVQLQSKVPQGLAATPSARGGSAPTPERTQSPTALPSRDTKQLPSTDSQPDRNRAVGAPRPLGPTVDRAPGPTEPSSNKPESNPNLQPRERAPTPPNPQPQERISPDPRNSAAPREAQKLPRPEQPSARLPAPPKPAAPAPHLPKAAPRPQSHPQPHPEERHPEDRKDDNR